MDRKKFRYRDTDRGRTTCENEGRNVVMHLWDKEMPEFTNKHPKARRKAWNRCSCTDFKRNESFSRLGLSLLTSRIMRRYISLMTRLNAVHFVVLCHGSPRNKDSGRYESNAWNLGNVQEM